MKKYFLVCIFIFSLAFSLESEVIKKISDGPDPYSPNDDNIFDTCQISFQSAKTWAEWIIKLFITKE